jgi:hypothetical protein
LQTFIVNRTTGSGVRNCGWHLGTSDFGQGSAPRSRSDGAGEVSRQRLP